MVSLVDHHHLLLDIRQKTSRLLILKAVTGDLRRSLERAFEREIQHVLRRWSRTLSSDLRRSGFLDIAVQQAQVFKKLPVSGTDKFKQADDTLRELLNPLISDMLESSDRQAIQRITLKYLFRFYELGAVIALQSLGFPATSRRVRDMKRRFDVSKAVGDIVFELTDKEIIENLESRAIKVGRTTSRTLIGNTRKMIRDNVYLGTQGTREVADTIAAGGGFPEWKALQIARTETQVAFNTSTFDMFQRSGVKMHSWITVGDQRVRPEHFQNELGGSVKIGKPFPSGQFHPGDGALSINCRCSLLADLSDPNLLLNPWRGNEGPFLKLIPPPGGPPIRVPRLPRRKR